MPKNVLNIISNSLIINELYGKKSVLLTGGLEVSFSMFNDLRVSLIIYHNISNLDKDHCIDFLSAKYIPLWHSINFGVFL